MNKKIKVIDVFNIKANNQKLPKKIKYQNNIFELSGIGEEEYTIDGEGYVSFLEFINYNLSNLNDYVEILDESEEIEESKEINFEEIGYEVGKLYLDFAKGIERAVNQMRKEKKDDTQRCNNNNRV